MDSLQRKYCSSRFLDAIKHQDLDADLFINAQDSDWAWVKTLVVLQETGPNGTYAVSYADKSNGKKTSVHIKLVTINNALKIDKIW